MSLQKKLQPVLSSLLTSDRLKNTKRYYHRVLHKLFNLPHGADFYFRVDDPYSVLIMQMLPSIQRDFHIRVRPRIVLELPEEMHPGPEKLEQLSIRDARELARFYRLTFGYKKPPTKKSIGLATQVLLKNAHSSQFFKIADSVVRATWGHDDNRLDKLSKIHGHVKETDTPKLLEENLVHLVSNGHYLSGTLHYDGEWYCGVDRIAHLTQRLAEQHLANRNVALSIYQKAYLDLHRSAPVKKLQEMEKPALDFYFSFRSPYSYLALQRVYRLQHRYNLTVNIKPVLPMVMRGLPIPQDKRRYILLDTKREADMHHIPFGKVCDPLSEGVERAMGIFMYAMGEGKTREYLLSITRGVWAEGRDISDDKDMQLLIERADLDWDIASQYMYDEAWQPMAEQNRADLNRLGLWGVPSFQFGDLAIWGQDRLWLLEQKICDLADESQAAKQATA